MNRHIRDIFRTAAAVLAVWLCAFSSTACLENPAVTCKNGLICAPGNVCDDAHGGCATSSQIVACSGKAEEAACSYPGTSEGACYEGVCLPTGCGNGVMATDEICDDGNRMHGDGCSADCRSTETCGNGVADRFTAQPEECDDGNNVDGDGCRADCTIPVCGDGITDLLAFEKCDDGVNNSDTGPDACRTNCQEHFCGDGVHDSDEVCDDGNTEAGDDCFYNCQSDETCGNGFVDIAVGEQCDDGNSLSHDGCLKCRPELAAWTADAAGTPDARTGQGMIYDAARGKVVMFGGIDASSNILADTWEWDGSVWTLVTPADGSPPARYMHAMAYDVARRRVVMFGGFGGASLADTWEWNGSQWTNVTPTAGSPSQRYSHAMTYDAARRKVVLFGGSSGRDETWEWNGSAWTNVTPSSGSPTGREGHAMVFNAARGKVMVFGGASPSYLGDVWEWNGSAWSNVTPSSGNPSARRDHAMTYDAVRGKVVMFGGHFGAPFSLGDTWEWNGSAWSNVTPSTNNPPTRRDHGMAYDLEHGRVVMFGGGDTTTWVWDGSAWTNAIPPSGSPPVRYAHSIAYDAARARVVLFGGATLSNVYLADTWDLSGSRWTNVTPATNNPPGRGGHALAYDSTFSKLVMFGGTGATGLSVNQTWVWDGSAWSNVTPATSNPSARQDLAMAYDAARGKVVMFGGTAGAGPGSFADTWEWNGSTWTNVTPASGNPVARYGHTMTFDAARSKVVMFGGYGGGVELADTWEWNGTTWTNVTPGSGNPGARIGHVMTYDAAHAQVVLFGGFNSGGTDFTDTWTWDGSAWTNASPSTASPPNRLNAITYDAARGKVVLFRGLDGGLWEWNGVAWSDVTPPPSSPPASSGQASAYDASRGRVVMVGGYATTNNGPVADTWEWIGSKWIRVTAAAGSPPARDQAAIAYDAVRKRIVLFGGIGSSFTALADTWEWDGSTWMNVTPSTNNPPARGGHTMAYDVARGKVVMFGGVNAADTWTWNGTAWTNVTPATGNPPARYSAAMAYDAARGKVVMFGGANFSATQLADTWEWNGSAWSTFASTQNGPSARRSHAMTYDASRGKVIMFSGSNGIADTWEWSGSAWTNITPDANNPPARYGHAMAYDTARRRIVMFAGQGPGSYFGDTWTLRYERPAPVEACRYGFDGDFDGFAGCLDPDCFGYCTPVCNPALMTCDPAWPRCGDGMCQAVENARLCPSDCGAPTPICGDFLCDSPETIANCPGDCS